MNTNPRNYGLYAIAVAITAVGALALGVPVATLFFGALALSCPLMMIFMMRGMHGGGGMHGGADTHSGGGMHGGHDTGHEPRPEDAPRPEHDRSHHRI